MGFSDEDRILIEKLSVFKGHWEKYLLKNFQIKVEDCVDFWKKLWETGMLFCYFLHWKYMESLLFFYSVMFLHKLDIIELMIWLQISSATIVQNITKIGQHLTV